MHNNRLWVLMETSHRRLLLYFEVQTNGIAHTTPYDKYCLQIQVKEHIHINTYSPARARAHTLTHYVKLFHWQKINARLVQSNLKG